MEHKQNISVSLKVREIIFDIMNKTHLTGHAREAEGKKNYEAASYMQASEDDEASYQIRRSVSNAFASIKVRLGEYLDENKTTTDNLISRAVDNIDLSDQERLQAIKSAVNSISTSDDPAVNGLKSALNATNCTLTTALQAAKSYVKNIVSETDRNRVEKAVQDSSAELVLEFKMPSNFHNAAIDSLGNGCHQYVVNKSISDWFVITNPEEAASYTALADEALETAKRALYKRARPSRPSYT